MTLHYSTHYICPDCGDKFIALAPVKLWPRYQRLVTLMLDLHELAVVAHKIGHVNEAVARSLFKGVAHEKG